MKGNDKILERLNFLLADELTAVSQYMVHSEMCANWGYGKIADVIEKRAIDEMKRTTREILQLDTPNEHGLVRLLKSAMARVGVYGGSVYQDESLRHQTEFSPAALRRLGFDVSGCIGWVTRKRIRLGPLWNL